MRSAASVAQTYLDFTALAFVTVRSISVIYLNDRSKLVMNRTREMMLHLADLSQRQAKRCAEGGISMQNFDMIA